MPNLYEAHLSSGKVYNVTTDQHHDDHTDSSFKKHLLDVIKGAASNLISEPVIRFVFKGRK